MQLVYSHDTRSSSTMEVTMEVSNAIAMTEVDNNSPAFNDNDSIIQTNGAAENDDLDIATVTTDEFNDLKRSSYETLRMGGTNEDCFLIKKCFCIFELHLQLSK